MNRSADLRPPFAQLLRSWRTSRKLSQLDLALSSEISQRHLSFLESGRAQPSRGMVLHLAEALDMPLRERNLLLSSAGFAPLFRTRALDDPAMQPVAAAIRLMLKHHEPNPAVVIDRDWNVVTHNQAMQRLLGLLGDAEQVWHGVCGDGPRNILRLTFHPRGMRPFIANWDEIAPPMIARLRREAEASGSEALRALLREALAHPDMPPSARIPDPTQAPPPVLPLQLARDGLRLSLFTMLSTFGTPQDITTDELRIESFFPADEDSAQLLRMLAAPQEGAVN